MRNLKELKAILVALYAMNYAGENDKNTRIVLEYAFQRILGDTARCILFACIGKTKEQIWEEVKEMLKQTTDFENFVKTIEQ